MFNFKINLSLLKSKQASERGAALAELALAFPIALTIVLVTIHLSHVLRESNVVVEAARHGARSVSAASGMNPGNGFALPAWADTSIAPLQDNICSAFPTGVSSAIGIATDAACGYLQEYFDTKWPGEQARWRVAASIFQETVDANSFWFVRVQVAAIDNRGPVDHLRNFFGLKPEMTATFPLMRVE